MQIGVDIQQKYEDLKRAIRSLGRVIVTFSGGVDSAFLLRACVEELGSENVLALTGISPTYPEAEKKEAERIALSMGAHHVMVPSSEMEDENFLANTRERCYHCKTHLFKTARAVAARGGYPFVLEGSNVDDLSDFRPGRRACAELGVKSPLLEVRLTKAEIRILSRKLGLMTHDKPAQACLSSRIPYGTPITLGRLESIERSERFVRTLGISQVRVRHHGEIARLEVEERDFPLLLKQKDRVVRELKNCGFTYVALDLRGYRTGSMNEPGESR